MIAAYLEGEVEGNPNTRVSDFAKIEEGKEGNLSFLSGSTYEHYLYTTGASIVLVNRDLKLKQPVQATLVRVEDSYEALDKLLTYIESQLPEKKRGIHPLSFIEESARVGRDVYIGPFVYVGKGAIIEDEVQLYSHTYIDDLVHIKKQSILYAGVKVCSRCEIGERVIIGAGTVIGSDE